MSIKISDYIASYIASMGVKHVFLLSGGGNVQLIDSITKNPDIEYVCNHHEQAAAIAAEGYSRVTQNLGVCMVTVGPGVTNTITGIAGAWLDSIPTIYIAGQVKRDNMIADSGLRQLGVQEIETIGLVKTITKYAAQVLDPNDIKYHLEKAIYLATSGRPGPVFLEIPADVQSSEVDIDSLRGYDPEPINVISSTDLSKKTDQLISMIKSAKRPLLFVGHGIRMAKGQNELLQVVDRLGIPVVTSMSSHDLIPTEHNLVIGRPGVFGDRAGNFAVQNCDLLISVGVRHHLWNIGYNYKSFAAQAKKVVVDIDEIELKKKTVKPDLPILSDAKEFLVDLQNKNLENIWSDEKGWIERCSNWKKKYPVVLPEYKKEKDFVNSYYFTEILSQLLPENQIILTGVGTSFTGTLQSFKTKKGQRLISNVGCAAMGYDLPAAIGACFGQNKKRTILIVGDGGIMLNLQELQTIRHHKLPIKIFLLNNQGYLAIRNTQNSFFEGKLGASGVTSGVSFPDFKKIASAFEIEYKRIEDHTDLKKRIKEVLESEGPVFCDLNMSPEQPLIPKVYSMKKDDGTMDSKSMEDMYPFLDEEEFKSNMNND